MEPDSLRVHCLSATVYKLPLFPPFLRHLLLKLVSGSCTGFKWLPHPFSGMEPTPVTVITGYLGAGKTTFLTHILDETGKDVAVVVNEFGDTSFDADIIKGEDVNVAELGDGCVCCAVTGMFTAALEEVVDAYGPEHIFVECSGAAKPENVLWIIQNGVAATCVHGVVTVADSYALNQFPSVGATGREQFRAADLILLNKTDRVTAAEQRHARHTIREMNTDADIIPVSHGEVDLRHVFSLDTADTIGEQAGHDHAETSMQWQGGAVDTDQLRLVLKQVPDTVRRVKGRATLATGETVLVQYSPGQVEITQWNKACDGTELVIIGDIAGSEQRMRDMFNQCEVA